MKDYYYILGLKKEASIEDIKKAYRKLSLKFHPDKNDGDDFFSDRFKEIQEAYETLSNSSKRIQYDKSFKSYKEQPNSSNGSNFEPVIEYFQTDKNSFEYNEDIKFSWKTINSDKVSIKPFGFVKPIDQRTYKIKDFKTPHLNFELIAENSKIGRYTKQTIKLNNRTYQELYFHFKKVINSESKKNNQSRNNYEQESKSNKPTGNFKTNKGIIRVELNFENSIPAVNNRVYQNGSPANNGKYKLGFMNYLVVKNGLIVELTSF